MVVTEQGQDSLVVAGQVLAVRADCMDEIRDRACSQQISEEQAWLEIKAQLKLQFSVAEEGRGGRSPKGARTPGPANRAIPSTPGESSAAPAELSDDILPAALRNQGVSFLEAINTNRYHLPGGDERAELLRQTVNSTAPEGNEAIAAVEAAGGVQFPLFNENVRVMPSDFNRTSLFHVTSRNVERRYCRGEKLGQVGSNVTIYYQGEELRQNDEAVYRKLIHLARGRKPWEKITLRQYQFMQGAKGTQRHLSSKDMREMHDIFMRLRSGLLLIRSKKRGKHITCNLISDYEGDGLEQVITIDPRVVLLFDSYATIDATTITSLCGIGQKLYSYLATIPHDAVFPISTRNLFELCYGRWEYLVRARAKHIDDGDRVTKLQKAELAVSKKFSDFHRRNLPDALEELKREGKIVEFTIDRKEEKVTIVKAASFLPVVECDDDFPLPA